MCAKRSDDKVSLHVTLFSLQRKFVLIRMEGRKEYNTGRQIFVCDRRNDVLFTKSGTVVMKMIVKNL